MKTAYSQQIQNPEAVSFTSLQFDLWRAPTYSVTQPTERVEGSVTNMKNILLPHISIVSIVTTTLACLVGCQPVSAFSVTRTFVVPNKASILSLQQHHHPLSSSRRSTSSCSSRLHVGAGEEFMVKEFSMYEQLQEIVDLAKQPLPERPDGIVCVAKFTSAAREDCRATEAQYEQMARENPATIFLRCFEEYDNASILLGQAAVQNWPTYDVFYGGNRVARVDGPDIAEVEELLNMYQFQNSQLDLFSESADNKKRLAWSKGEAVDPTKVPRTTNRFIPGYDWNSDGGFFDDLADKAQNDFEDQFGNWLPNTDDK